MAVSRYDNTRFGESLRIQLRVIGAVMLRELHTRFGRNNVGYLWLVLEPLILSGGVSIFHVFSGLQGPLGFQPGPFYAVGYIIYIIFRNNVNRAAGLIESNKPLLYHRNVTLLDINIARVALDVVATLGATIIILSIFYLLGIGLVPERPWLLLAAMLLMAWLSLSVGLMVTGFSELSSLTERIVHPMTYLILPFSGMFTVMDELPRSYARLDALFPFPHMADLARMGLRSDFNSSYLNVTYVLVFNACCTVFGILLLRVARGRMHFD